MNDMNALVERYHGSALFAFVYILEAHAVDEWPVRCTNADLRQHKSLSDRANAAKRLVAEYPLHPKLHLLLDNEANEFNNTYASWPFRYWVVQDGVVRVKMMPNGDKVTLTALQDWCAANLSS
jgi:hypothetical protein